MHLILLFLFFSFSTSAKDDLSTLAKSPKWIKLLHYKKNITGSYVSEADAGTFFLHKDGKKNPELELRKTVEIFSQTSTPNDDHAICKFPLRYKWLNRELGMPWNADFSGCQKYISFFSKLAAKRASIVFSSYYLTNPNSAFGHTLLRLSRYDDKNETEMLDYGINYAAKAKENNPFLYAIKGLFGGFIGEFAAIPYYYKIREYTNFEFRDLWSYDLKLIMPEVLEMVDHIWELGNTYFDYFYFHENCSYHLLSVIDVARPSLNLTDRYSHYTIPADTVRLLHHEGLIDEGKRRESTYSKLIRLSEDLNQKELNLAKEIANHPKSTAKLVEGDSDQKAADVLDVSIEAFDYFNFEKILKDDPATKELKSHILTARAKNPIISKDVIDPKKTALDSPAYSHSPTRWVLAENYYDQIGKSTRFEFRAALHDLLDPPAGSLKEAQLEIGKVSFELQERNYQDAKLILDNFSIFNIKNYAEQNFWASPISWDVELGVKQLRRLSCFDCPAGFVTGSVGNSLQLARQKILLALLLNGELNIQSQFENNYRVGLGPKMFARYRLSDTWVTALNTYYHFNTYEHQKPFEDYEWWNELELRHHLNEKVSLSLKGGGVEREREWFTFGEFGLQYFYE
ncbi:MAG: DUF4105 domain-containing protein [Bacteriovoracaceae bacterium]|nr:DUF4105 domain-containing protein [Bacteriovoracaceae bacterium]